ncbi:MAG: DUF421 domain-containing protein [Bradymonadaceae bacterium]|nr:DUF421 domain-containing protein [Lujinxingiaceae bacterium]
MFFESWTKLAYVGLLALLVYLALIVLLRVTGKRTTSKMNAFDWVVTVALGSMVSTVILVDEVPLLEGLTGIAVLVLLQFIVAKVAARSGRFQSAIKATPTMLLYEGEFLEEAMRKERVSREEIIAAMRAQGFTSPEEVYVVVLETNAEMSILGQDKGGAEAILENVRRI